MNRYNVSERKNTSFLLMTYKSDVCMAIRLAMMYDAECWATKGQHIQKMSVAEIWMLRWICGHTRKY
jgi:hypothetical protein